MRRFPRSCLKCTAGAFLLSFSVAGCGTIFGGSSELIQVNSAPSGASITTNPETATYTTPTTIRLERKNSYTLIASKEGYNPAEFRIERSMRAGILILDILLFPVGVVVDAVTGGWYKLEPKAATFALERTDASIEGPRRIEVTIAMAKDGDRHTVMVDATEPGVLLEIRKD